MAQTLYISPATASAVAQASLRHTLTAAAREQVLLAASPADTLDVDDVYARAAAAFEAFALVLAPEAGGEGRPDDWVLGGDGRGGPTLLDAALFAYTHLLLDEAMGWRDRRLVRCVGRWEVLARHRERVLRACWGEGGR
jgi:metaxin